MSFHKRFVSKMNRKWKFKTMNGRWKTALQDLSFYDDVTNDEERKRVFDEIFSLSAGSLAGYEVWG